MTEKNPYKYDVFISYGHKDKDWVEEYLVPKLAESKLRICQPDKDFKVGEPIVNQIKNAIRESKFTIIILTPDYVRDNWIFFENLLINSIDPENRQKRVLPILLRDCELPLRIRNLVYLDLTHKEDQSSQFGRFFRTFTKEKPSKSISETNRDFEYNLINLNNFCRKSFNDRELIDFSYDHFSRIYECFSLGMTKEAKIRLIIEYCERYQLVDELVDAIKKYKPELSKQIEEVIEGQKIE